jgi:hypothetical protein
VVVASNGTTFILNFMKTCHLVQKLKGGDTQRQHGDLISLLFFLKKESKLNTINFGYDPMVC